MALMQIAEPGQATAPHQHRLAVGIDLGTTNSLVATVRSGSATVLADADGAKILPSVVHYGQGDGASGESVVTLGAAALALATSDPLNTVRSVKRLMGKGADDGAIAEFNNTFAEPGSDKVPRIVTAGAELTAVEISADILTNLRSRAEESLGGELVGAVITVPAYFDDACLLYTSPSPRDGLLSRMPSSA